MTKLQIISKLWSIIYDLLLLIKGSQVKTLEEIENEMDIVEYHCRKYVDEEEHNYENQGETVTGLLFLP